MPAVNAKTLRLRFSMRTALGAIAILAIRLDLSGTDVSDAGLMSLLRMEGLTNLNLTDTRVTAEGVARLKSGWRGRGALMVLSGTTKKAASAPQNPSAPGQSGTPGR